MRKILRVTLIIAGLILLIVAGLVVFVKTALPRVGPPPELSIQATPGRLARGEYLALHVAACMDCHSQHDWGLYGGPVKPGTFGAGGEKFGQEIGFPGTVYSSNITPAALAGWTDGELFRAITTGETKDGRALFPLMAYHNYGQSDPEDIMSIIAYLRSLPAIRNEVPARQLDFPLNILVNTFPSRASLAKRPDSNNIVAYGKYLTIMADCGECHSKVEKGALVAGSEYGGGRPFRFPDGTVVTSTNITPDEETGLGEWNRSAFIRKFKQYRDSGYTPQPVPPGGHNTVMPWLMYSGMQEKDLAAIFAYLKTLKPIHNAVKAFAAK
jgi:mono/diheme cytochrome c family protein